jgi:RimJ/RimL family protein N-acetyltransferase
VVDIWTGERVRLRGIEPEDWPAFREFDDVAAVQRNTWLVMPPRPAEGYRQWTREQASAKPDNDTFNLAIESQSTGLLVGSIATNEVRPIDGHFGYGLGIGKDHQRRGYGRDAVLIVLRFMFTERRYVKCTVGVYAENKPSRAMHATIGFTEEGRVRRYRFAGGRHEDLILYGLTAEEFADRLPTG